MWLFVNNQPCFGYIQITTLNNKNTFGAPYIRVIRHTKEKNILSLTPTSKSLTPSQKSIGTTDKH